MIIYPDKKWGQKVSGRDFNAVTANLEALNRISVQYPLELTNSGNNPTLRYLGDFFWARIYPEDNSDEFSAEESDVPGLRWKQVVGEVNPTLSWHETGLQGDGAFEVNGATIYSSQIVKLYPVVGGGYVFELGGYGAGSGSNSSDYPEIPTNCVRVLADLVCDDGVTVKQFVYIPILANVVCQAPSDEPVT